MDLVSANSYTGSPAVSNVGLGPPETHNINMRGHVMINVVGKEKIVCSLDLGFSLIFAFIVKCWITLPLRTQVVHCFTISEGWKPLVSSLTKHVRSLPDS